MISKPIIIVDNLKKNYGKVKALQGISFSVMPGEIIGLLGPNGAGKSTFFSILTTITKLTSGNIFINGLSIHKNKNAVRKIIGYIPQELALYPTLSGMDNLIFWSDIYGINSKSKKDLINQLISDFDLKEVIHRKVDTYSGGMKRRLNVAVGILHNPSLLIMDEPFVGVDISSKRKITDILLKLKANGAAIIFSSHSLEEVEKTCDRIILLEKGSVKAVGTLEELLFKFSAANLEDVLLEL